MQNLLKRCRFLNEFSNEVLLPLNRTPLDPFSSHKPSVDSFGWAFASASSRAFRSKDVLGTDGHVMIPLLDMASHSTKPNCKVLSNIDGFYELQALVDIPSGAELLIDYGPMTNEECFRDYGFSLDDNEYDSLPFIFDANLLDISRGVMGQAILVQSGSEERSVNSNRSFVPLGRGGNRYEERWLHSWQIIWLRALGLLENAPGANFKMKLTGSGSSSDAIDGRAYALLRVLYAKSEEDITKHGYDPNTLATAGGMLSPEIEKEVIKTLVGLIAILLRIHGTNVDTDLFALRTGFVDLVADEPKPTDSMPRSPAILADAQKILRSLLKQPVPLSTSQTARKAQLLESLMGKAGDDIGKIPSDLAPERVQQHTQAKERADWELQEEAERERAVKGLDSNQLKDEEFNVDDIRSARRTSDISDMGFSISVNVREVLKYRIRRKRSLPRIVRQLASNYQKLSGDHMSGDNYGDLLPDAQEELERRAKLVRELQFEEGRGQTGGKSHISKEEQVLATASAKSKKWFDDGRDNL